MYLPPPTRYKPVKRKSVDRRSVRLHMWLIPMGVLGLTQLYVDPVPGQPINWHALATSGLATDILGFLLIALEWRQARKSPQKMYVARLAGIEKSLAKIEAKEKVSQPGGSSGADKGDATRNLLRQASDIIRQGPEAYAQTQRFISFETGTILVIMGFIMQFVASVMTGQGT